MPFEGLSLREIREVCELLTHTPIQVDCCVKILKQLMEKGVAFYDETCRKTIDWLKRKKVLEPVKIDYCQPRFGKRSRHAYILNTDKLRALYNVLHAVKAPPLCLHDEDVA